MSQRSYSVHTLENAISHQPFCKQINIVGYWEDYPLVRWMQVLALGQVLDEEELHAGIKLISFSDFSALLQFQSLLRAPPRHPWVD